MAKFVTIGYGDQQGYDSTKASIRAAAHAHDAQLRKAGVVMGVAGKPVQVLNPGGTETSSYIGGLTSALTAATVCESSAPDDGGLRRDSAPTETTTNTIIDFNDEAVRRASERRVSTQSPRRGPQSMSIQSR